MLAGRSVLPHGNAVYPAARSADRPVRPQARHIHERCNAVVKTAKVRLPKSILAYEEKSNEERQGEKDHLNDDQPSQTPSVHGPM